MRPLAILAMLCGAALGQTQPRPRAPQPAAHATPSPLDLKFPPLHAVEPPKAATFTLSNGMKLMLLEDHELPVIRGEARVRTGNLFDPADKAGLASMTGIALRSGGTREMTGEQLDRKLDDMASRVESSIGELQGQVTFSSLAENSAETLKILRDVLTRPVFRMDQVEMARIQLRREIARRNDDAKAVVARQLRNVVFGESSPYGRMAGYESVERIRRSDLVAFYNRYFFPRNTILAICGDFETAKIKDQMEQLFAGWTVEQPAVPPFPQVANQAAPGVYFAKNSNTGESDFAMGHLGSRINDKDYAALVVMANLLGGGNTGRLAIEFRGRTEQAFTISAEWAGGFDQPGLFVVRGSLKPVSTVSTLQAIQRMVAQAKTGDITNEELRFAKDRALNTLVYAWDTPGKLFSQMLQLAYFGYPDDFMQQHQKALAAVTKADVVRVAKEYLRPQDLTIVVAGNPAEFVPAVESLGQVHEIDLAIPEPAGKPAASDPDSIEQGKAILAKMQQALGGAGKLAAVRDYAAVREVHFAAQAGGADTVETEKWMAPGNMREESQSSSGTNALYCDGKSGWIARGRTAVALRGPQLKSAQDDVFRSYFTVLLSDRLAGRTVTALDSDLIEITGADGQVVQVSLNAESGLPWQFSYQVPAASGPPTVVQETITKFGEAGGVKVPFEIVTMQNGVEFTKSVVRDFKVNSGLVLADLERRP